MNIAIIRLPLLAKKSLNHVPTTPRGRALFTTDWFLNGRPVLRNHDNTCLSLTDGQAC
ncbi:MAG: hypothetical protein OEY00_11910 [Gammaproteobacteria bacterium]|nr:hypothetical protein [Gammaproteobacteria bacterium]